MVGRIHSAASATGCAIAAASALPFLSCTDFTCHNGGEDYDQQHCDQNGWYHVRLLSCPYSFSAFRSDIIMT